MQNKAPDLLIHMMRLTILLTLTVIVLALIPVCLMLALAVLTGLGAMERSQCLPMH